MLNLISNAIASLLSSFKKSQLNRLFASVLVLFIFLSTSASYSSTERPIGERIGEKLHQTSENSERPKTTGEFLDEAEGDVPLDKRLRNIGRDSAEAFGQFGEGITTSVKETARELGGNAAKIGK